jgi:hypothetical protein
MSKDVWDTIEGDTALEIAQLGYGISQRLPRWDGDRVSEWVYMIHLLEYHPEDWVTVLVRHRDGSILEVLTEPDRAEDDVFQTDMSVFDMHRMDIVAVLEYIKRDILQEKVESGAAHE